MMGTGCRAGGMGIGDQVDSAGGDELTGTAGSSNGTGQSRAWGVAGASVTAGAGGCGNEGAMGAASRREGSSAEGIGSSGSWADGGRGETATAHVATGIATGPSRSRRRALLSGCGCGSSGRGGGCGCGTRAGVTCAARAGTNPPRDTPKESPPVRGSEPSGKGGGRTDGA